MTVCNEREHDPRVNCQHQNAMISFASLLKEKFPKESVNAPRKKSHQRLTLLRHGRIACRSRLPRRTVDYVRERFPDEDNAHAGHRDE